MVDADAPRKCAFTIRVDAALEEHAFHAPSFRFRFLDGSKKQTSVVGAAGWTAQPETPGSWRFETVIPDVVVSAALAGAIDDDPIVAFILTDQSSSASITTIPAAATGATGRGENSKGGLTTGAAYSQAPTVGAPTSGRGRLVADMFELDASALFSAGCLHVEETWSSRSFADEDVAHFDQSDDASDDHSIFKQLHRHPSKSEGRLVTRHGRSLFAAASGIRCVTIHVGVNQPLLSPLLRDKLNPLNITLGAARRLPGIGAAKGDQSPHTALAARCRPVYACMLWSFFPDRSLRQHARSRLVVAPGRAHGETVTWQHTTTILSGRCDPTELLDALQTGSMSVEIHDRDSFQADAMQKLHAKWESLHATGIEPTGMLVAPVLHEGTVISPRSQHPTPRVSQPPRQLDAFAVDEIAKRDWRGLVGRSGQMFAYGVATFRLDELLLKGKPPLTGSADGSIKFKLTSDVLARKRRATPIGAADLITRDGDPKNLTRGVDDTPTDKQIREPGAYGRAGTTLSIRVTLHHPIRSEPPASPSPSSVGRSVGPFARFVLLFPYKEAATVAQLLRVVEAVNRRALPAGTSIRSYQMTPQEKHACEHGQLDVLTGCMVIDDAFRLVLLEGLADGAMQELHLAMPRLKAQSESYRMFANDQLRFTHRLYTAFDVDLKRIKLRYTLPVLLQMPDIYMRTKVAELCYAALTKLMELRLVSRLAEVQELDLFPTADMLLNVESKYGESISLEDIYGKKKSGASVVSAAAKHHQSPENSLDTGPEGEEEEEDDDDRGDNATKTRASSTNVRLKAPTDATNPQFDEYRRSRRDRDFLNERRALSEEQRLAYQQKKEREDEQLKMDPHSGTPVFMYSGQKLRTQDALQDELRKKLSSDHRSTYTYGPEFQSLALSLVNPDELRQTAERDGRKKWTTQRGFVYPAPRPPAEYSQHPTAPSEARCEDLHLPFVDNANHPKPVARDNNRNGDARPEFTTIPSKDRIFGGTNADGTVNPEYFRSVHLCGEQMRREMDEALQKEQDDWERKLVVDRSQIKFLAHGNICSQPRSSGPQASQLDKLRDILNGPVKSKPLRILRHATLPSGKRVPLLPPPASILSLQEYAGPVAATFAGALRQSEKGATFLACDAGTGKLKDFHFPTISDLLTPPVKKHTTHQEIRALKPADKLGFLWSNHNQ